MNAGQKAGQEAPARRSSPPASRPTRLSTLLGYATWAIPTAVALSRAAAAPQWRDDLPAVRDLGLVPIGWGGAVTTMLTQIASLMPLGSLHFRSALVSVVALGLASASLYALALRATAAAESRFRDENALWSGARPAKRLGALLACIATLTAALSPTWQREATVGGGAMVAIWLSLWVCGVALRIASPSREGTPARDLLGLGALTGALVVESPPAALAMFVACAAALWLRRVAPGYERRRFLVPGRALIGAVVAALFVVGAGVSGWIVRLATPRSTDVGWLLSLTEVAGVDAVASPTTSLFAWARELGLVALGAAALGLLVGAARGPTRWLTGALAILLCADTLFPAHTASVMAPDLLTPLRALGLAALAVLSSLGVYAVVVELRRHHVPFATPASAMLISFFVMLVALTSEEAGVVADRTLSTGAEEWTDVALDRLEPTAALLVHNDVLTWRVWAAQRVAGRRPDVIVLPTNLLPRQQVATDVLVADAALQPVVRTLALTGQPGEFAMSKVADVRPLHVELDPRWSDKIVNHLVIDGVWLEYAPQPLGSSDRQEGAETALSPLQRVFGAVDEVFVADPSTARITADALRQQALVLSRLGDTKSAGLFLERVASLSSRDPLAPEASPYSALAGLELRLAVLAAKQDQ